MMFGDIFPHFWIPAPKAKPIGKPGGKLRLRSNAKTRSKEHMTLRARKAERRRQRDARRLNRKRK